jgi:hypothetical protein
MKPLLIFTGIIVLFLGALAIYAVADDIRTQQCYAECHTDTECEACDR